MTTMYLFYYVCAYQQFFLNKNAKQINLTFFYQYNLAPRKIIHYILLSSWVTENAYKRTSSMQALKRDLPQPSQLNSKLIFTKQSLAYHK